ncbi:toprim domain-containing protein [Staphylococcus massiliensis]|uniref:TOPRIM domain-containing protein n=1 Tax=Staphylococcus massiliensis S46 TaxID=1229783 RepID=K9ASW4_9STAP|nr:toprim domain-containing protein [Staphylococcus massiliensis]EKU45722.1 TOPRIM domain-containing protein [Staphylococcus massiliensis S46]MCG3400424.1 toprim domain-containing protein [Staphylococcus massiliensis]MCG3401731.1 toprim domain-containing protein [Staphylococcus massiliensis]MCG3413496.1 toprim domain-containing protein [Staphylococcus massiliensis]PNZ97375.1 topiosmerase [Staphylococcus massiliensis CCUG 55927]
MTMIQKVIVVEGKSDKKRVKEVLNESVEIICTHGTMSIEKIDNMLDDLYDKDVFILADADEEGEKIRKWFRMYLSESTHIYIDSTYNEVSRCPRHYLSRRLERFGFKVKKDFVLKGKYTYHECYRAIEQYI